MNREDIIRMAREAGGADITSHGWTSWVGTQSTDFLERFAALVAAQNKAAGQEHMTDREMMIECPRCGHCCPQPNQEPDFWALFDENQRLRAELKFNTTPRQWVGLTDEEVAELSAYVYAGDPQYVRLIEAKLKEKNT
jgi:hypothetical protein